LEHAIGNCLAWHAHRRLLIPSLNHDIRLKKTLFILDYFPESQQTQNVCFKFSSYLYIFCVPNQSQMAKQLLNIKRSEVTVHLRECPCILLNGYFL